MVNAAKHTYFAYFWPNINKLAKHSCAQLTHTLSQSGRPSRVEYRGGKIPAGDKAINVTCPLQLQHPSVILEGLSAQPINLSRKGGLSWWRSMCPIKMSDQTTLERGRLSEIVRGENAHMQPFSMVRASHGSAQPSLQSMPEPKEAYPEAGSPVAHCVATRIGHLSTHLSPPHLKWRLGIREDLRHSISGEKIKSTSGGSTE